MQWIRRLIGNHPRPTPQREIDYGNVAMSELDSIVSAATGLTVDQAASARRALIAAVALKLDHGYQVVFRRFARFCIVRRPAKSGTSFGHKWSKPERDVPRCYFSDDYEAAMADPGPYPDEA